MQHLTTRTLAGGRAILYCGDSLALLQAGALPEWDALVSDPPYGIGFQHSGGGKGWTGCVAKTDRIIGDDDPFDPRPWTQAAGDRPVVLFGADHYKTRLPEGGRFLCWDKSCGHGPAASFVDAEFMWTNRRNPRVIVRHFWMGRMRADDGADGKRVRHHVSQKPVSVMAWCLETARVGIDKVVLDPYMGSGSTGVACLQTGRRFVGVEIDPAIFETACQRIEAAWDKTQCDASTGVGRLSPACGIRSTMAGLRRARRRQRGNSCMRLPMRIQIASTSQTRRRRRRAVAAGDGGGGGEDASAG